MNRKRIVAKNEGRVAVGVPRRKDEPQTRPRHREVDAERCVATNKWSRRARKQQGREADAERSVVQDNTAKHRGCAETSSLGQVRRTKCCGEPGTSTKSRGAAASKRQGACEGGEQEQRPSSSRRNKEPAREVSESRGRGEESASAKEAVGEPRQASRVDTEGETVTGPPNPGRTCRVLVGTGTTSPKEPNVHMASQRASNRKSLGAEGGSLAQVTLSKHFGEDEEIM